MPSTLQNRDNIIVAIHRAECEGLKRICTFRQNDSKMSFRFHRRIKIAPGLAINLSKGLPSLSIGRRGATINLGRRGPRATLGIPGTGMSWQFGGDRQIHKTIQAQANVRAVHAQGTVKAVKAQSEIIAITKRMETVAKRLARNTVGSRYWKKAAIEQAQLLDKMLDVAKSGENDQLVAAVQKCHHAWGDGNPHFRAALDSGMTITECLAKMLAGEQPDQKVSTNLLSNQAKITDPVMTADMVKEPQTHDSFSNPHQVAVEKADTKPSIDEPALGSAFWKAVGRNLILPVIGCGVIAVVYMIAADKLITHPQVIVSATPTLETPTPVSASPTPAATLVPEARPITPIPQLATPTPSPVQITPTPSKHEEVIHGKAVHHKHPTHNLTRQE